VLQAALSLDVFGVTVLGHHWQYYLFVAFNCFIVRFLFVFHESEIQTILCGETVFTVYVFLPFEKTFQALNLILLTSSELSEIRDLLKQSLVNPAGKDLYISLYASWCHSPMAIISLCFVAQVYIIYNLVMFICFHFKSFFLQPTVQLDTHTHTQ
jgi:hypothetical protein